MIKFLTVIAIAIGLFVAGFAQDDVEIRPRRAVPKGKIYFAVDVKGFDNAEDLIERVKIYARTKVNALATARGIEVKALGNNRARTRAAAALGITPVYADLDVSDPDFIVPISLIAGDEETVTSAGIDLKKIRIDGAERRNSVFLTAAALMMDMDGDSVPFGGLNPGHVTKKKVTGKDYTVGVAIPREILKFLRLPQELTGNLREEQRHGALPKMLTSAIDEILGRIVNQLAPN